MAVHALHGTPLLTVGEAGAENRVNELHYILLALQTGVEAADLSAPPTAVPTEGQAYIISGTPTGDWASFSNRDLVVYTGSSWVSYTPTSGVTIHDKDTAKRLRFNGSSWSPDSDRFVWTAQSLSVGATTTTPFSVTGEQPNTDTVTYGFPISFPREIKSIIASFVHLNGSDPGDWNITVEDHGGGGTTYFSRDFPLNASSAVAEVTRKTNDLNQPLATNDIIQINATGPSTATIIIMIEIEFERTY